MYLYLVVATLLAVIGLQISTAAPVTLQEEQREHPTLTEHQTLHRVHHRQREHLGGTSMREAERILHDVGDDATIVVGEGDTSTEIVIPPISAERPRRRTRRSAALLLHAAIRMCDQRPLFCQTMTIQKGEVKVKLRFADQ